MLGQPFKNYIYLKATDTINYKYIVLNNILRGFIDMVNNINI